MSTPQKYLNYQKNNFLICLILSYNTILPPQDHLSSNWKTVVNISSSVFLLTLNFLVFALWKHLYFSFFLKMFCWAVIFFLYPDFYYPKYWAKSLIFKNNVSFFWLLLMIFSFTFALSSFTVHAQMQLFLSLSILRFVPMFASAVWFFSVLEISQPLDLLILLLFYFLLPLIIEL